MGTASASPVGLRLAKSASHNTEKKWDGTEAVPSMKGHATGVHGEDD